MSIREFVDKAKELLDFDENVKVIIKPLKTTLATISLNRKIITIDPRVMNLEEELIIFILVHELIHLKIGTVYHTKKFWKELEKVFGERNMQIFEKKAVEKFHSINF